MVCSIPPALVLLEGCLVQILGSNEPQTNQDEKRNKQSERLRLFLIPQTQIHKGWSG